MAVAKRFKIRDPDNHQELGLITGTYTVDWDTGKTIYHVHARRVDGAFVIEPKVKHYTAAGTPDRHYLDTLDADEPYAHVQYGIGDGYLWETRTERPVVNGITLTGGATINLDTLRKERLTRWNVVCGRGPNSTSVPYATHDRVAHVVDCLLRHWILSPHNYALRLTACRLAADAVARSARKDIEWAEGLLAEARRQLDRAHDLAECAADHAAAPPAGPAAPGGPPRTRTSPPRGLASGNLRTHLEAQAAPPERGR